MSVASLLASLGHWAPLLVLLTPLLLAGLLALPRLVGMIAALAPWAVLPALLAGLLAPQTELLLPELLLGSSLMIDPIGRPFMVLLALLWLVAGWLAGERLRCRGPALLFLLAMCGSFGLAVAGNLVVFLLASTVSGYALYGLAARQPGARALVLFLVLSDLLLFELLLLLVKGGVGLSLAPAAAASTTIAGSRVLLLLTLLGFGAKAALFGLHAWLPRMLSGTALELSPMLVGFALAAGLLPWLRLLPPEAWSGSAATLWSWLALAAMGLAVILGLRQRGQRALLGYALSALSGYWLLLSLAGGELSAARLAAGLETPAPELAPELALELAPAMASAMAPAMALGQAGLALAALLLQAGRRWAPHSWLDWLLHGGAVLILADAVLAMMGSALPDADNGFTIAGCGFFGLLIGRLLFARRDDNAVALAIGPGVPIFLMLMASAWALLSPGSLMAAPLAASVLIAAAVGYLLLEPFLMRLPRVPPGDLLVSAAKLYRRRFE